MKALSSVSTINSNDFITFLLIFVEASIGKRSHADLHTEEEGEKGRSIG
jgi:hypothetical protein